MPEPSGLRRWRKRAGRFLPRKFIQRRSRRSPERGGPVTSRAFFYLALIIPMRSRAVRSRNMIHLNGCFAPKVWPNAIVQILSIQSFSHRRGTATGTDSYCACFLISYSPGLMFDSDFPSVGARTIMSANSAWVFQLGARPSSVLSGYPPPIRCHSLNPSVRRSHMA